MAKQQKLQCEPFQEQSLGMNKNTIKRNARSRSSQIICVYVEGNPRGLLEVRLAKLMEILRVDIL